MQQVHWLIRNEDHQRFGRLRDQLVDVSLLEIAKRQARFSPTVLTVNLPLYGEDQRAGFRMQLILDLLH